MQGQIVTPYTLRQIFEQLFFHRITRTNAEYELKVVRGIKASVLMDRVLDWHILNIETYAIQNEIPRSNPSDLRQGRDEVDTMDIFQLLKALRHVETSIDMELLSDIRPITENEQKAMDLLSRLIRSLMEIIVTNLPEYKAAQWPDE